MRFEKVSFDEFTKACEDAICTNLDREWLKSVYEDIKLPKRATEQSAGYDFFFPFDETVVKDFAVIPTGIRFICEDTDKVFLMCVPRSGLGFKYGAKLRNTVGVIDADYCKADNEGHIKAKFGAEEVFSLQKGKAFMQGIIMPYLTVDCDDTKESRHGGFGSTDSK